MSLWYVDNAASGGNTGANWANAWESFADIGWAGMSPGDTLYISGGSSTKTYYEGLNIQKSGSAGLPVYIKPGALAGDPSGHDGTVIIDGSDSRQYGVRCYGYDYVWVNGLSGSSRKIKIQNVANGLGAIYVRGSTYAYMDYMEVVNDTCRGAYYDGYTTNSYCRLKGCYIYTGAISNSVQTDGIYAQYGENNTFEYNVVQLANSGSGHCDCFQSSNGENNCIVRGNWLEWVDGYGNSDSQALITELLESGYWMYIYNNVILGCSYQPSQAALIKSNVYGTHYIWNNLIISQHSAGTSLQVACADSNIGAIKNNILVSNDGLPLYLGYATTTSKVDYNCLWRKIGTAVCNRSIGTNNLEDVDPDYDTSDEYRHNPTSPCIDAGTDISAYFTNDRDERTRPKGTAWDIGPYEYEAATAGGVVQHAAYTTNRKHK